MLVFSIPRVGLRNTKVFTPDLSPIWLLSGLRVGSPGLADILSGNGNGSSVCFCFKITLLFKGLISAYPCRPAKFFMALLEARALGIVSVR
jgi:hypothetical protein